MSRGSSPSPRQRWANEDVSSRGALGRRVRRCRHERRRITLTESTTPDGPASEVARRVRSASGEQGVAVNTDGPATRRSTGQRTDTSQARIASSGALPPNRGLCDPHGSADVVVARQGRTCVVEKTSVVRRALPQWGTGWVQAVRVDGPGSGAGHATWCVGDVAGGVGCVGNSACRRGSGGRAGWGASGLSG